MAKKVVKAFTKNYNGEALKAGEKMIAFEYTELDAENCTNTECIKTIRKAGRSFKVIREIFFCDRSLRYSIKKCKSSRKR